MEQSKDKEDASEEASTEQSAKNASASTEQSADHPSPLMELVRILVSVGLIAAGVAGMFALGSGKPPAKAEKKEDKGAAVDTVKVVPHEGKLDIRVDGVVVPFREIQIAAEVAGRITMKSDACRTGNFIEKDAPLVEIDKETFQLEVDRLTQSKMETQQNLDELAVEIENTAKLIKLAEDDLALRKSQLKRQIGLKAQNAATKNDVENAKQAVIQSDNAKTTLDNQKSLLEKRQARLKTAQELARIQLERAKIDLQRTEIAAPVSGVIVSEMVEANSFVQRGTQLLMIEDTSQVEVRCNLTMDELYRLWQSVSPSDSEQPDTSTGQAYDIPEADVTVTYELAGRTFSWSGRLERFDGIGLDERTRTVPCRVVVDKPREVKELQPNGDEIDVRNGPRVLVRGMFVNAMIHTKPSKQFVLVPEAAVRPGNKVWLVRDNTLTIRKVTVAGVAGNDVIVDTQVSDIKPGESAVISPLSEPIDGMPVQEIAQ